MNVSKTEGTIEEKPVREWQRRFRGMSVDQITRMWSARAAKDSSWSQEANFHIAVAERMRRLSNMALDLDRETRAHLCHQADSILNKVQHRLSVETDRLAEIDQIVEKSDKYFQRFGSCTIRRHMYERGVIDRMGDLCGAG